MADKDLKSVRELHVWNKRVLSFAGLWPLEKTFFKFYAGLLYFAIHLTFAVCDLVYIFGDMSLMIANLLETSVQIMVGVKMMVLRHSKLLKSVLRQVESATDEKRYKNQEEKNLYLSYNSVARLFFATGHHVALLAVFFCYIKPLEDILYAVFRNETIPFVLPYRIRPFTEITDFRAYILIYLCQCPMLYFYYFHTISVCFLCTLIAHVAGDSSILAHRIRQVTRADSSIDYVDSKTSLRNVIIEHHRIIWIATSIDDIFNAALSEELVISTILLALTFYRTLEGSLAVSMFEFIFIMNYCIALIVLILVYCLAGDFLIRESVNIRNAYYESGWPIMNPRYQKYIIICICRSQKPLQLTAGRFYVFSLARFSEILKTAMAYISMLRNVG